MLDIDRMTSKSDQNTTKMEAKASSTEPVVSIDPDGDLILRVGAALDDKDGPISYRVCSSALRRASPVCKAMLFGPWREARPANECEPWRVELPEDSPRHLCVLLDIIHGNFSSVPQKPATIDDLACILSITDKYELAPSIQPWASGWATMLGAPQTQRFHPYDPKMAHCIVNHIQKASAAWRLGCEEVFSQEAQAFLFNSKLSEPQGSETSDLMVSCGDPQPLSDILGTGLDDFEGKRVILAASRLFLAVVPHYEMLLLTAVLPYAISRFQRSLPSFAWR
jgi:hypothetical protein